ncbi:hypothetical protein HK104_008890 [Borealophlyctis nickersoniae]|nr:hypothetical protein HK104_008890 [Borealophlyctis nickersoniae]
MAAVTKHLGGVQPENLNFAVMGLPAQPAMVFVKVDIRALLRLSPDFPVEVIELEEPTIESLPTPAHKRNRRDGDGDHDVDNRRRIGGRRAEIKFIKAEDGMGAGEVIVTDDD